MGLTTGGINHNASETYASMASVFDAITAGAGGGQSNAVTLTAQFNRITTVASGNDSVALPAATVSPGQIGSIGSQVWVMNSAASNSMQVFGTGSDTINDVTYSTGVAVAAGKSAVFTLVKISSTGVGGWYMTLSA